jgi:hypothetical protein
MIGRIVQANVTNGVILRLARGLVHRGLENGQDHCPANARFWFTGVNEFRFKTLGRIFHGSNLSNGDVE